MTPSARLVALSLLALSAGALTVACGDDHGAIALPEYDGSTGSGIDSGSDSGDDASEAGDAAMAADADAGTAADADAGVKPGDAGGGGDSSTGGDAGNDAAPPSPCDGGAPVTHDVTVGSGGFMFAPSTLTICAGDTVRWTWASGGHTVTSGANCTPDNQFCSPNDTNCTAGTTSSANTVYTHTFPNAGTFPYFCVPHCGAGMTGTITVQ